MYHLLLKALHRAYVRCFVPDNTKADHGITDSDEASRLIYELLRSGRPCMVARFGSMEMNALMNYIGVAHCSHNPLRYVTNRELQGWWNPNIIQSLQNNAGFFPATADAVSRFGERMLADIPQVDILGSWLHDEEYVFRFVGHAANKVHLRLLEPFWSKAPWSRILGGKRVVVVHPFAKTIADQYTNHRSHLFANADVLPEFASLRIIQAVQSIGGEGQRFKDWFEALAWMEQEIEREDFDICLIGCGAYGFPLAAHVKRMGKQAVHLGGALQLLFGIKGKRWENPMYGVREWGIPMGAYAELINEHWVKASLQETPKTASKVENACYW